MTLCHMTGAGYNIKIIELNATLTRKKNGMIYEPFLFVTPDIVRYVFATVLFSSPLHASYVSSLNDAYPTYNFSDLNKLINLLAAQHTNQCIEMLNLRLEKNIMKDLIPGLCNYKMS